MLQVSYIEFSPDEKYVLSYSSREPTNPQEKAALLVNIFDAQSGGGKLRKFEGSIEEFAVGSAALGDGSLKWPIFKWAASGYALLSSSHLSHILSFSYGCHPDVARSRYKLGAAANGCIPCTWSSLFSLGISCCAGWSGRSCQHQRR